MRGNKRVIFGVVAIFFIILFLNFVSAELVVNGPDKTSVNIGDEISINGYVIPSQDILGLIKFELNCGGQSSILMVKSIIVNQGSKKDFSDKFAIISANENVCVVAVNVESGGSIVESKESSQFKVTSALTGTFSINKDKVQVGESVTISGESYKQSGAQVNGFVTIYLKKEGQIYFSESTELKNGKLKHELNTKDIPGGDYTVEVETRDSFGNYLSTSAGSLSLIDNIEVNANANKAHYLPSEKVAIEGTANVIDGKLGKGKVYVMVDGNTYDEDVSNGNFDIGFYLLNTVKTGKHDINVRVEDAYGNFGVLAFSIIVDPIPTKIVIVSDKEAINPGESLNLKAFLNDQAGDIIDKDITLKVVNEKGDVFYDSLKKSAEQFQVTLASDVVPGNYFIKGTYGDLEGEKLFIVGQVTKVDYSIQGQELIIKNSGNIPYDGIIQIKLEGTSGSKTISKDIDLGVSQEERINLGKGMDAGVYRVVVEDNVFENVEITGGSRINYKILSYIVVIIILILFWIWLRKGKKISMRRVDRTIKEGGIYRPHKKPSDYGGAPLTRVKSDEDHVKKYKEYMQRNADFKETPKHIFGLGKKREESNVFSFGVKKRVAASVNNEIRQKDDFLVKDVFRGVKNGWSRDDVENKASNQRKEETNKPPRNLFGLFDM